MDVILQKRQLEKVIDVTTAHDFPEKYMVVLKEGYTSNGEEVDFFNTEKEVRDFIDGAIME